MEEFVTKKHMAAYKLVLNKSRFGEWSILRKIINHLSESDFSALFGVQWTSSSHKLDDVVRLTATSFGNDPVNPDDAWSIDCWRPLPPLMGLPRCHLDCWISAEIKYKVLEKYFTNLCWAISQTMLQKTHHNSHHKLVEDFWSWTLWPS